MPWGWSRRSIAPSINASASGKLSAFGTHELQLPSNRKSRKSGCRHAVAKRQCTLTRHNAARRVGKPTRPALRRRQRQDSIHSSVGLDPVEGNLIVPVVAARFISPTGNNHAGGSPDRPGGGALAELHRPLPERLSGTDGAGRVAYSNGLVDAVEAGLVPASLTARTAKVYCVPLVRPVITCDAVANPLPEMSAHSPDISRM